MNFPDCREGAAYDHSFDSPFATLGEVRGRKKVRTAPKATSRRPAKKEDANIASPPKTWERSQGLFRNFDVLEAQLNHRHIAGLQRAALRRVGGRDENRALAFLFVAFGDDHPAAFELLAAVSELQPAALLTGLRGHEADFFRDRPLFRPLSAGFRHFLRRWPIRLRRLLIVSGKIVRDSGGRSAQHASRFIERRLEFLYRLSGEHDLQRFGARFVVELDRTGAGRKLVPDVGADRAFVYDLLDACRRDVEEIGNSVEIILELDTEFVDVFSIHV